VCEERDFAIWGMKERNKNNNNKRKCVLENEYGKKKTRMWKGKKE